MQAGWSSNHTCIEFEDKSSVAKAGEALLQSFLITEKLKTIYYKLEGVIYFKKKRKLDDYNLNN